MGRVVVDALLVTISLALVLAVRLAHPYVNTARVEGDAIGHWWTGVAANAPLLAMAAVAALYLFGFYREAMTFRSRHAVFRVVGAASLGFLVFAVLHYTVFARGAHLPRSSLLLAWITATPLLTMARLWPSPPAEVEPRDAVLAGGEASARDRPPRVLVVGGGGYIGSAMVPQLLAQDYHVRVLDIFLFGKEPLAGVLKHPRLQLLEGDFRHIEVVLDAMRNVDTVIHLGAIVGDPACSFDEELTIDVNLAATRTLAETARASGVRRFVFASTCSVYGASDQLLDERSPMNPISLYARTKVACERGLQELASPAFTVSIGRLGTIYGVSGRLRFDLVVNVLTARAALEGVIPIHGGSQWRPLVHVEDAARAMMMIAQSPPAVVNREVFNVGCNQQNYTIQQIGELIQRRIPAELQINGPDTDARSYRVDFGKVSRLIGFRPEWTVEQGVDQILEMISSGEVVDYKRPLYDNHRFLREYAASRLADGRQSCFDLELRAVRATSTSANQRSGQAAPVRVEPPAPGPGSPVFVRAVTREEHVPVSRASAEAPR